MPTGHRHRCISIAVGVLCFMLLCRRELLTLPTTALLSQHLHQQAVSLPVSARSLLSITTQRTAAVIRMAFWRDVVPSVAGTHTLYVAYGTHRVTDGAMLTKAQVGLG